ncbi:MAG TPA: HAD-IIA family hydrolase [Actinomycetota bacterium]|nr:HAD-IIA family hydrolase [Actinomycetota bacterium]
MAGDDAAAGPGSLFQGYIFDLDGTVYLGDELLPGAARLLARLRELDRRVAFVSNNPTRDQAMYVDKLRRLGVQVSEPEVLNTVVTMTSWLVRHHPDATVFPIAEEPLRRALASAGIRMSDRPEEIDIVVASYDRGFDYRKLQIAFDAIWFHRRARLVTTNPDRYCPFPGGRGEPDAGAIVAAIEACTGATCEVNAGKPDPLMLEAAMDLLGLAAGDCVMVGDRLATDIRMARAAGMASALVLTGDTTEVALAAAPEEDRPTWVLERIDRLLPPSAWAAG